MKNLKLEALQVEDIEHFHKLKITAGPINDRTAIGTLHITKALNIPEKITITINSNV